MNTMNWLIRREFWENRAIWMIPAVFGGLVIIAALFGEMSIPTLETHTETYQFSVAFLMAFAVMFYAVMSVYATWYLLDCLYADRKDRSILFWKSLPLSDTRTVISKLIVALVAIPLVYFAAADVTALLAAFIVTIRARAAVGGALWQGSLWAQIQVLWLYAIIVSAVWFLPFAGWLMLVSAWAKRAVMLWAILPPLVLCLIERVAFGTHVLLHILGQRLLGLPAIALQGPGSQSWSVVGAGEGKTLSLPTNVFHFIYPAGFFSNAQTWIGAALGVALIAGAIQLRMRRTEM